MQISRQHVLWQMDTFRELVGMKYTTKLNTPRSYTQSELRHDLRRGCLRLKVFATSDAVFSVQDLKILQQNTDSDVSDLIETIVHMHAGDDPMSEKEALAGPDAEKWREAMKLEIAQLMALGCWRYEPKSKKPAGKKVYRGKMFLKTKPSTNGQLIRHKARYVFSDPNFL